MCVRRFIDIGANLTDSMYSGIYHGSKKHEPDLNDVLERSWSKGVEKIIITGGRISESKLALELANKSTKLFSTVGCHPTRCDEFDNSGEPDSYLDALSHIIEEGKSKVVAVGECGLDYDRLQFCNKDVQLKYFEKQLVLSKRFNLPLFLHCRNAAGDLIRILSSYQDLPGGVVHSFDGTLEEARKMIDLGYFIGINGCSLKTEHNLDVVKTLPVDRIMIETDSPWCEIKPTHAGSKYVTKQFESVKKEKWKSGFMVKGRNEPANIVQVLEVLCNIKNESIDSLSNQIYKNTLKVFFPKETIT